MLRFILAVSLGALFLQPPPAARAQCGPQWLPGLGLDGANSEVAALGLWDPDGSGPKPSLLLMGGYFQVLGNKAASSVGAWDGSEWSTFGSGFNGRVMSFAILPSGNLIAAGTFTQSGTKAIAGIARWSGSEWQALGDGLKGSVTQVYATAVLSSGNLVVGGIFTKAGSVTVSNLAMWDGSVWSAIGGSANGTVKSFAKLPNGDLIAAGEFTSINGVSTGTVARWDGTAWSSLFPEKPSIFPQALAVSPAGEVFIAGGAPQRVYRWNGSTWQKLGADADGQIWTLHISPAGELLAGGAFEKFGTTTVNCLAKWNGSSWVRVAGGLNPSSTLTPAVGSILSFDDGTFVIGGYIQSVGSIFASNVARLSGETWSNIGKGIAGTISPVVKLPGGRIVVGGAFSSIDGVPARNIALWDGLNWSALGEGFDGGVSRLAAHPSGDIIAVGQMRNSSGTLVTQLARWKGGAWNVVPVTWSNLTVDSLTVLPNGDVVLGGFGPAGRIARFDGSVWHAMGSGLERAPTELAASANGEVFAVEPFYVSSPGTYRARVQKWSGTSWSMVGSASDVWPSIKSIAVLPDGQLVIGTMSTEGFTGAIYRWNGSSWSQLGGGVGPNNGIIEGLVALSDGRVLAGGLFQRAGGLIVNKITRWNGSQWEAMGSGVNSGSVSHIVPISDQEILISGSTISIVGDVVSSRIARWVESAIPTISAIPKPVSIVRGDQLVLQAGVIPGIAELAGGLSYHWKRNDQNISDGAFGASPGGGVVSGASGMRTRTEPFTLRIDDAQISDAGSYAVSFTNACGQKQSTSVEVKVKAHITDINADGQVDDADFLLFTTQYDLMLCTDPSMPDGCSADFNHDGFVDDADFTIFIPAYNAMLVN